jgi:predicted RNase H-like nuclease (RuvC/YqgF family)
MEELSEILKLKGKILHLEKENQYLRAQLYNEDLETPLEDKEKSREMTALKQYIKEQAEKLRAEREMNDFLRDSIWKNPN